MYLPIVRSAIPYLIACTMVSSCLFLFRQYLLSGVPLVLAIFLCWFFRDPGREAPEGDGLVLAPCDGRVLDVSGCSEMNSLLRTACKTISIFMSPLDVHVNRSPVSGQIIHVSRRRGSFAPAFNSKARESNARNIIGIHANGLTVFMVQIAGFLARRIECHVKVGDFVKRGQRIGMIRFGSRVDLILPEIRGVEIVAEKGRRVKGGETIVARWIP